MIILDRLINVFREKRGRILSDKLINNIFWNSIARFGSAGLNFLMTLFLMSALNVADYGEFVVFFSIYSTIPFFFDFGLNNSFVSIGAKFKFEGGKYDELISTFFTIKAVIVLIIIVLAPLGIIFRIWESDLAILIILGGALGLWECLLTIFKSSQDFKLLSKLIPIRNLLAFAGVLLMYYLFNIEDWWSYLYLIMTIPLLISVVLYFIYFKKIRLRIHKDLLVKTFSVSKWIALFTVVTAIHAKADIYLLKYFATIGSINTTEIGIFSAAFSLLALTNVLTSTFAEAILPKVSEESNRQYFLQFIDRLKNTIPFVILLGVILGFILYFAFTFGFNGKYINSIQSMLFIGIGMIFTFYIHTLNTLFYPLGRTDLVFKIILLMFGVNIVAGVILIPILGATGAAITNMLVCASGLLYTILVLNKILLKNADVRI